MKKFLLDLSGDPDDDDGLSSLPISKEVAGVFKCFPLKKIDKFIQRSLDNITMENINHLYDPLGLRIEFTRENFDKICFHFTLAIPMKGVSIEGASSFYHEAHFDPRLSVRSRKKTAKQVVEAAFTEKKYPEYMKELEEKKAVLVQDIDSMIEYPPERTFLAVTKERLKEVIETNMLVGETYDFTKTRHCQFWCLWENQRLGLGTKFSCQFVNDFFESRPTFKLAGKLLKKMVVRKMDVETDSDEEEEKKNEEEEEEESNKEGEKEEEEEEVVIRFDDDDDDEEEEEEEEVLNDEMEEVDGFIIVEKNF